MELMGWTAPAERHRMPYVVVIGDATEQEPSVMEIITIGLDLAKRVFQVHGVDATGRVAIRRKWLC